MAKQAKIEYQKNGNVTLHIMNEDRVTTFKNLTFLQVLYRIRNCKVVGIIHHVVVAP